MSDVVYRLATEEDFPIVTQYYAKLDGLFRDLGLRLPVPEDVGQVWLDSFRRTLGRFSNLWVAELDGDVVAFLLARVKRTPPFMGGVMVGELADEWVEPRARRLGIADKLCRFGFEWLRQQEVHSVEIRILMGNEASWAMLKPMGFTPELTQYRVTWDEYIPEKDA
ncbi:MAG: GNAT family N-acetyltransferase [Anaerolineae bacterium]|nr:GNAT family N-acetyltransferase [Anaerolineae bacterium]